MNFAKYFTAKKIVAIAGIALLSGGCKKYLDQQPQTAVGPAFVFSSVTTAYQAIIGVYSRLAGDQGYGKVLSLYYPVDNDETQGPTGTDAGRRPIARYQANATNAELTNPFNQLFQGIDYANICIDNIPKMSLYSSGTDQQRKQLQRMYGEALTLRALFYWEAIKNWGDLPAQFQPAYSLAAANPFPVRVGADTLYNQVIADLKTAEDLVPWRNDVTSIGDQIDERITKAAVKGLRARIALFRGGYRLLQNGIMYRNTDYLTYYQIAKDECNDIIASAQHALNPSFRALWKDQVCAHVVSDPQGELIFQVGSIGLSSTEDSKLGYYNGPTVNGLGNKSINILPTYFYLFDSTDLRRDVTCAPYILSGTDGAIKTGQAITAINDGKYRRDWITNPSFSTSNSTQYLGLKWQLLRYSDVLLMMAEADNEISGGPTAAAYTAINTVRRRAYGKPLTTADATVDLPANLSKTDFFTAIVKERSLEFGGEGIRKYDLIRWNLLNQKLADTKTALTNMSNLTGTFNGLNIASLPVSMFLITGSTGDDKTIWKNSFYAPSPTSTPSGTTKITWLGTAGVANAIYATCLSRYAPGFITGHSELLPIPQPALDANFNLTQNFRY